MTYQFNSGLEICKQFGSTSVSVGHLVISSGSFWVFISLMVRGFNGTRLMWLQTMA